MVRVLVAEDSATVRELLVEILESDPEIRVVGQAKNGQEAVELATRLRPDLVTMDIHMPVMGGFEATKEIMIEAPTPIIIVSSGANQDVELSLNALRVGALTVLPTPGGPGSDGFAEVREHLVRTARAMAEVKVVRRWRPRAHPPPPPPPRGGAAVRLVAMAASTGGPAALQRILMDLPPDFPVPILIVQHIAPGFVEGLCSWLAASCSLRAKLAQDGEPVEAGTVYLAPDDAHLGVDGDGRIRLSDSGPIGGFRPSANFLFESAARSYGASTVAVVLTGMGRDGVDGLRAVHAAGGRVIAQDEASSVVYGMPREAVQAGVVGTVLPLQGVASRLMELLQGSVR